MVPHMFRPSHTQVLKEKAVSEFFAGIGLVRLGLERAGWSIVFANDIAEYKEQLYTGNIHDKVQHLLRNCKGGIIGS